MKNANVPPQLKQIDAFSRLLDSNYRIPGTNIRFGYDFIIGLIPFGGDLITFLFSGGLVLAMVRHGASGHLVGRMLINIVLDALVGSIPVLGDIFDIFFKANRRNYRLLERHYTEGKYQGSIWKVMIPVIIVLLVILVLFLWLTIVVIAKLWELIAG